MHIVLLRTNSCLPDPRVEKEVDSLMAMEGTSVKVVCWDRDGRTGTYDETLTLAGGTCPILRFGIPASWGGGMADNFFPMLRFEWRMFWWLMTHRAEYDTIHACDLLTGLPAVLPAKLFRKTLVYDIYDYYAHTQHGPKWILEIFRHIENWVIGLADATIICAESRVAQIEGSHPRQLVVLHNAPSPGQLACAAPDFPLAGDSRRVKIVYVGNLVADRLILKVLACAKDLPQAEFHIGGFGVLEEQVRQLAEAQENIFFYGKLPYDQVIALEQKADILLALYDPSVPNHIYAAPNKFYEALALGKPLIVFRGTDIDRIVLGQDIGCACEPTEAGILAALEALIARKADWPRMGETMKGLFHTQYSWQIMEHRLQNLYRSLHSEREDLT